MDDFTGQRVIVTGGTGGIGGAVSKAFLKAGANVIAVYAEDDEKAEKFKKEAEAGDRLETVKLDVSDYAAVERFFKDFEKRFEKLDVLVNCAGIRRDSIVGMMKAENWKRVIDVNLTGTFNTSKHAVLIMMKKRYGRIINITSPVGKFGLEGQANYSASKAGQVAFTLSLAKEVAKRNITVNCVSPGFIETKFISDLPENIREAYKNRIPLKRFGKPEEVAPAVLFLSTPAASYITGSVLEVTGGL